MTSSDAAVQERLTGLVARGFQFIHPTGPDGALEEVIGVRIHDDMIDVVRLLAEDRVAATRMRHDEENILAPKAVLWQSTGHVIPVLDDVLALHDRHVRAPV